jgi:hypothetical protein
MTIHIFVLCANVRNAVAAGGFVYELFLRTDNVLMAG